MSHEDIIWNGQTYRRHPNHDDRNRRVYYMATNAPRTYLHRALYEYHHGPIPSGWHVHHKDHDPLNNDPANLEAISPAAHAEHHGTHLPDLPKVCAGCQTEFIGKRTWAKWCSPACKEATRRSLGKVKPRVRKGPFSEARDCEECGAAYEAKRPWARFCTPKCKQRRMRSVA